MCCFMINCSKIENGILFSFVFVCGGGGGGGGAHAFQYFSKFAQISNLCISDLFTGWFLMSVSFWFKKQQLKSMHSLQFTLNGLL